MLNLSDDGFRNTYYKNIETRSYRERAAVFTLSARGFRTLTFFVKNTHGGNLFVVAIVVGLFPSVEDSDARVRVYIARRHTRALYASGVMDVLHGRGFRETRTRTGRHGREGRADGQTNGRLLHPIVPRCAGVK
jgi:hypothetical protein